MQVHWARHLFLLGGYSLRGLIEKLTFRQRPWGKWIWSEYLRTLTRNSRLHGQKKKKKSTLESNKSWVPGTWKCFPFFPFQLEFLFLLSNPWHYLGTAPTDRNGVMKSWEFRMWPWCVTFTDCQEIHSRVKQMGMGVGFRHAFASLLLAFTVIHWPDSVLMVHLYMQLIGKEKDKNVPRAVLLRFWSKKRNSVNKQREKPCAPEQAERQMQGNLYLLWLNGHEQILEPPGHLLSSWLGNERASQVAVMVRNPPANAGDSGDARSLAWEDPLEEEMATCSRILAWKSPWTGEPHRPQSMGSQSQKWLRDWAYVGRALHWGNSGPVATTSQYPEYHT